jgi:hypothetical protein
MRWVQVIVSMALLAPTTVLGSATDSEVVAAVLEHLAADEEAVFGRKTGLIFVAPMTRRWMRDEIPLPHPKNRCELPLALYDGFVVRNGTGFPATPLLLDSPKWREPRPGEEVIEGGRFVVLQTADGQPVKTVAQIAFPAYSSDEKSAFLMLRYRWSVHSASAQYALERIGRKWRVKCMQSWVYF